MVECIHFLELRSPFLKGELGDSVWSVSKKGYIGHSNDNGCNGPNRKEMGSNY